MCGGRYPWAEAHKRPGIRRLKLSLLSSRSLVKDRCRARLPPSLSYGGPPKPWRRLVRRASLEFYACRELDVPRIADAPFPPAERRAREVEVERVGGGAEGRPARAEHVPVPHVEHLEPELHV